MGKYFTLRELIKSDVAIRSKIDNTPTKEEIANINLLIDNILDPLREAYGGPIIVTSGYRCERLNKLVKGSKTSQHRFGQAADIRTVKDTKEENKKLFDLAIKLKLPFDQLIDEYDFDWVHISYSPRNRRQILHIK